MASLGDDRRFQLFVRQPAVLDEDIAQSIAPIDDRGEADASFLEEDGAEGMAVGDAEATGFLSHGEKLQDIYVEGKKMQYLYKDGNDFVFMDMETFVQVHLSPALVSDAARYMKENTEVDVAMYGEKALSITLPNQVILKIVQTDPGLRGDTASGGTKPATLETGAVVQVPLFVEQETSVKVDTRTGMYLSRA